MLQFNFTMKCRQFFVCTLFTLAALLPAATQAQIFGPDGLRMPGEWNGYTNSNPLAGPFNLTPTNLGGNYTTTFQHVQIETSRQFKFASGGSGNPWQNEWRDGTFSMNTIANVGWSGAGANNNNNVISGMVQNNYYTVNYANLGYVNSRAIFMETTNAPVSITNVSQTPTNPVLPATAVAVTVTASAAPSPQEIVYVRYTLGNFSTSTTVPVTMNQTSNTQGTVNIPGQLDGSIVTYYVFTSTVASISTDHDMYTMRFNNNSSTNYIYNVAAAPPVNVVFRVNMSNTIVDPGGVNLAGNFNGNSTSANPMTPIGGGVYETTVALNIAANITYKFVNGTAFESNLGAPCGNGTDRTYTVTGAATLPTVCFTQCANCVAPVNVKFRVNMATQIVPVGMFLAGSFNTFSTIATPMNNVSGTTWEVTIPLALGTYQYKFVNSGTYENNLGAPCGNGNDRVVNVVGATTLPLVCINSCSNCPAVVQLIFRVNMSNVTVSPNGVHLVGSFNGFNTTANPMALIGGGVYSATVIVPANSSHTYKFLNDNSFAGVENVPSVCGTDDGFGGFNRNVTAGVTGRTLPTLCFGQCIDCGSVNEWSGNFDTNFGDGRNWTAGVSPNGCGFNTRIKVRPNQPTISGSFTCGNFDVQTNSTLTISNGATLNACGNVTGSGRVEGLGTLNMNGSGARTISMSPFISNLRIDNASGVSLSAGANVRITNTLKLQSGTLTTTGATLRLTASATNEARVLKIESGAALSGNITFSNRIAPSSGAWYFLGAPVTGQVANAFAQKGNSFAAGSYDVGLPNAGSIFLYDRDPSASSNAFGWRKPAASSTALPVGTGVRVFAKNAFMTTGGATFDFTGAHPASPVNFTIGYCAAGCNNGGGENGFNLVANPYPCTIDWDAAAGWSRTALDATVYVWNAALGNYATYNGIGVNGGTNLLAAGQGFMVKANAGSAAMAVNEDVKINQFSAGLRSATQEVSGLRIFTSSNGNSDEAWIDLGTERSELEAAKLLNPVLNLSLVKEGRKLVMAGLSRVKNNQLVALNLTGNAGATTLRFEKTGNATRESIYLRDNVDGRLTAIEENTSIEFPATASDKDRFSLVFVDGITSAPTTLTNNEAIVWPNPAQNFLMVDRLQGNSQYMIVDMAGKTLASGILEPANAKVSIATLPRGTYQIKFSGKAKPVKFVKE